MQRYLCVVQACSRQKPDINGCFSSSRDRLGFSAQLQIIYWDSVHTSSTEVVRWCEESEGVTLGGSGGNHHHHHHWHYHLHHYHPSYIHYSKLNPILSTSHTHTGGLFPRTAFNHRPRGVGTRGQEITFVTQARGSRNQEITFATQARGSRNQEITFSTQARRSRNQEITCLTQARMNRDQETTFKIKARRSRNQEITFATQASYCSYKYR